MRKNGESIGPLGKQYLVVVGVLGLLFLVSCATQDSLESKLGYEKLHQATITESQQLKVARTDEHKNLEQKGPDPELPLEPVMPSFNPLDDVPVSITMRDQPLHDVLFIVARNAGLNLVIEPGISVDQNRVTISFEGAKSSAVVNSLLKAYDLGWEIKENILYVKRFVEKTFDIGFLNVKSTMDMKHGGDILGTVDTGNNQSGNTGQGGMRAGQGANSSQFTSAINVETSLGSEVIAPKSVKTSYFCERLVYI